MESQAAQGTSFLGIVLGLVMWLMLAIVVGFGLMAGQMLCRKLFGYEGDVAGSWFKKNVALLKGKKDKEETPSS